jgi:uncharacterized membrane protein YhiD involved in acid resistance
MEISWQDLGVDVPDTARLLRVTVRLVLATLFGGFLGYHRHLSPRHS